MRRECGTCKHSKPTSLRNWVTCSELTEHLIVYAPDPVEVSAIEVLRVFYCSHFEPASWYVPDDDHHDDSNGHFFVRQAEDEARCTYCDCKPSHRAASQPCNGNMPKLPPIVGIMDKAYNLARGEA